MEDFGRRLLLNTAPSLEYIGETWAEDALTKKGFGQDGDRQLVEAVLDFTRLLLDNCGNRSIYSSSAHLSSLLNSSSMTLLLATLNVGAELAKRYQASLKRARNQSQQSMTSALLANHYNIDLESVEQLALPFVRSPALGLADSGTPASPKGKERAPLETKSVASRYANDLVDIVTSDSKQWKSWGNVRVSYYPHAPAGDVRHSVRLDGGGNSSVPSTPTPLRRSSTMNTPSRPAQTSPLVDDSPPSSSSRIAISSHDDNSILSSQHTFELGQPFVSSTTIYTLMSGCPENMPKASKYELFHRLRIAKALMGTVETRQQALAVRLLAILNLSKIHLEDMFDEKVLRQDIDETKRFPLVTQLADLIRPTAKSSMAVPLYIQSISMSLLESLSTLTSNRAAEVYGALSVTVSHGILLYVIRTAVAGMKDDAAKAVGEKRTEMDDWRTNLFSLTYQLATNHHMKVGGEMLSAGLMDALLEVLNFRSHTAMRFQSFFLSCLDSLLWNNSQSLELFLGKEGLDTMAKLIVSTVNDSLSLTDSDHGTGPDLQTTVVDYKIPFFHHQTLRASVKFIHHIMANWYSHGGNVDRLLRNMADKSDLLASLRTIMEQHKTFGASAWYLAVTIMMDFINNDPTSFAALSESGMIKTFLEAVTGRPVPEHQSTANGEDAGGEDNGQDEGTPASPDSPVALEPDHRAHPPTAETLAQPRVPSPAAGIPAHADAMNVIPQALNSISLNNAGLRMVVASRVLETYLEVFESHKHLVVLEAEIHGISSIGRHFDELSRHHPSLREPITNAVIDLVARIRHMGRDQKRVDEWGVKLSLLKETGEEIVADNRLIGRLTTSKPNNSEDSDVEMSDGVDEHARTEVKVETNAETNTETKPETKPEAESIKSPLPFENFVGTLSMFLMEYLGNSNLRSLFVSKGGIECLLDIAEAPSLTQHFEDHSGSRTLRRAVSMLVEQVPILGLPAVLQRTNDVLQALKPLAEATGEEAASFFAPFLTSSLTVTSQDVDGWDAEMRKKMTEATSMVRALLRAQWLMKTLSDCFPTNQRHHTHHHTLHPVNVFDLYVTLIKDLSPLLRASLQADHGLLSLVPRHWSPAEFIKQVPAMDGITNGNDETSIAPESTAPELTGESTQAAGQDEGSSSGPGSRPTVVTQVERTSIRYRNYVTLQQLLKLNLTVHPLFQALGKALLPKRDKDLFARRRHLDIAETLAGSMLSQLKAMVDADRPGEFNLWVIMSQMAYHMVVDTSRSSERGAQLILPVLLAFKEQGGFDLFNSMLRRFQRHVEEDKSDESNQSTATKAAWFGLKKILELYVLVVNGRNINESFPLFNLQGRSNHTRDTMSQLLVLHLRMIVMPVVKDLWESALIERVPADTLVLVVDILTVLSAGDMEPLGSQGLDRAAIRIFNQPREAFNWDQQRDHIQNLKDALFQEDVVVEAIYRANGNINAAREYCRAIKDGLCPRRYPVPSEDVYVAPPVSQPPADAATQTRDDAASDTMVVDSTTADTAENGDANGEDDGGDDGGDDSSQTTEENADEDSASPADVPSTTAQESESTRAKSPADTAAMREQLNELRDNLRESLIDKSLDVLRTHPNSAIDLAELIKTVAFKGAETRDERCQEVGETLANALSSLALSDEEKAANGRTIASYAHLLALLLQDKVFFKCNMDTLKDKVDEYLDFLKPPSLPATEGGLPPWISYILLVVETLLQHDEQPLETTWKPPVNEDEEVQPPAADPEPRVDIVEEGGRDSLLNLILDILPRIGRDESLATAALRVLVILTRKRELARKMGDRKNLQRLFAMIRQALGCGVETLRESKGVSWFMIILRHIIEDEETVRQIMETDLQVVYDNRLRGMPGHAAEHRLSSMLSEMASSALRAPDTFVDVAADMLRWPHWAPPGDRPFRSDQQVVMLKKNVKPTSDDEDTDTNHVSEKENKDGADDTEMVDVKPSTEEGPKEIKWPVVENPDGVMHFLLCELLNYRELDDKDGDPGLKESKSLVLSKPDEKVGELSAPSSSSPGHESSSASDAKDQKTAKAKPDEHPIHVYRCFLLHCLGELLQSYTRTKIEFLNFKRSAPPTLGNTPARPRAGILNYLINDLLCVDMLSPTPAQSVAAQKQQITSAKAQNVLVSLMTKTRETVPTRTGERFEYDDDADLLMVRKFVLDTVLRAYEKAATPDETVEARYSRMQCLSVLMCHMVGDLERDQPTTRSADQSPTRSQMQLRRMMYEKGFLDKLTSSIAEIDLKYPGVKRVIKHILRVLRVLTQTAKELSHSKVMMPVSSLPEQVEDDIMSTSSLSDLADDREDTPDLYRNSALGMLERRQDDDMSEEEGDDDDEDMYDDDEDYGDEMDYEEDGLPVNEEDAVSDDDDDELGDMGPIEGLPGDTVRHLDVLMVEDDDDDDDEEDDDIGEDDEDIDVDELDNSVDSDDDEDSEDSDDMAHHEDRVEIVGAEDEGGAEGDHGEWESMDDSEDDDEDELDFDAGGGGRVPLDEDEVDNMVRAVIERRDAFDPDDVEALQEAYLEDGRDDDEDEEEDDDDVDDDDEFGYEDEFAYQPPAIPPLDSLLGDFDHAAHGGHRHRRNPFPGGFSGGPPWGGISSGTRINPRGGGPNAEGDDAQNPLLRRPNAGRDMSPRPRDGPTFGLRFPGIPDLFGLDHLHGGHPLSVISDIQALLANLPPLHGGLPGVAQVTLSSDNRSARLHVVHAPYPPPSGAREARESRRDGGRDPQITADFGFKTTNQRYVEEAAMVFGVFGSRYTDKSLLLANSIMFRLTPPAMEEKKKEQERTKRKEEERKEREKKEREEKEAREREEKRKKEAEEAAARAVAEAAEAAEAAAEEETRRVAAEQEALALAAAAAEAEAQNEPTRDDDGSEHDGSDSEEDGESDDDGPADNAAEPMEGVETESPQQPATDASAGQSQHRVVTTIRGGEEVDVTELGIDPEYLEALPEEFREEVIAQAVTDQRSRAREANATTGDEGHGEVFQEFLQALPADLRSEIMQQEQNERRRQVQELERQQRQAAGNAVQPDDMDPASILLTFPPALREQVLLEQGEELVDHLPADLRAEFMRLRENRTQHLGRRPGGSHRPVVGSGSGAGAQGGNKVERRSVVQMLDKSGVATLLRLMFIVQRGHSRQYLFNIFSDVCENRQNRLEVISTLLQILRDGSTDMDAIERSFSQLSLKAKKPKEKDADMKTPQSLKRTLTTLSPSSRSPSNSEISPLLMTEQCVDLLCHLITKSPSISWLFLTEHDIVGSSLKRVVNRKAKTKEGKVNRYAINSLLSLLDRDLVLNSPYVMSIIADLLNRLTLHIQTIDRRQKEQEEALKAEEAVKAKKDEEDKTAAAEDGEKKIGEDDGTEGTSAAEGDDSTTKTAEAQPAEAASSSTQQDKSDKSIAADKAKAKQLQMPFISPQHLNLVVKIFVSRECSSKTFQNTIVAIKNLSLIPGAKATFGQELIKQAQALSNNIVSDLNELLPQIVKASSGTEIQGVALDKFSPGASQQNKLLRVLTALDHLFESKKAEGDDGKEAEKQDLIASLYYHPTFTVMWEKLSDCLSAMRQRENMLNVATILLPLIESLMAVCKNTATEDAQSQVPGTQSQVGKDMVLSSPAPESPMAGLFFTFTEEHRRILNELVRSNPKLMQGPFKLLVKNPKVLEFDNKRNYFNRSVHSRSNNATARTAYPSLQLSVRRDQVFHDSFRSLYFKTGDEMKYGKLNIRFHGEEGVDAGGVTREWFQVLSRQMFDPNYALFIPVSSDRTTFHPNKLSHINDEHLSFFKFIGRIIGKALYEGRVLECYFSRAVYKKILGKSVSVKDMESLDPDYYKSLVWMLGNDITDIIDYTFSIEDDEFGVTTVHDLIENGRNVAVTEENKHEYVRMVVEHKLLTSVKDQMEAFLKGFHDIIPADLISIFTEQELELLISGLPEIDVDDWKGNTEYHNYNASSPQIQWFWRAVRSFDKEERAKLLQFVTGTSKVPLNGFKELEGMNGVNRFNIHRDYGNKERLPSSHTCFNRTFPFSFRFR